MAPLGRLEIEIAEKRYPACDDSGPRRVLENLRLEVPRGQFLCLLGPSGCGKTTLLNLVAGLDRDFEGRIGWSEAAAPRIGYVFQEPRLLPWLTVIQNIELVRAEVGEGDPAFVEHLLEVAGLTEFRDAYPQRLSLGLARRVALVRAFAVKPDLLLMDEPFVSLDRPTAERLRRLLVQIWGERPTTVLFVTHSLGEALQLADRVVRLSPSPASVVADLQVPLAREARGDRAAMTRLREELLREQPLLAGEAE
ncbi:MAG: ATP-binding cassette domain-containing protein [Kiloniellales bacterium]|nr:ATP-binding cassette domain-containing protein [Kiloniellales bacterium]